MAASYGYLGRRGPVTGALDTTGLNPGNWTLAFTPSILNFTLTEILVYKIKVTGAPASSFSVYVDSDEWDANVYGTQNSWEDDGGDILVIRNGQTLNLLFNDPVTDLTPPVGTCFIRYDVSLAALTGLGLPGT
jgi:hypothetical protein